MNSNQNVATAKRSLYLMNTFVLMVHCSLLAFFTIMRVTAMSYVNIGSVLCYVLCYLLIKRELIKEYILTAFLEILIHSFLAVLCLGGGSDFQLYFIGSISIILFAQYFSTHIGVKPINGIFWSFVCAVLYVVTLWIDRMFEPLYHLSENIIFGCVVFNSIVAVSFLILFLGMLTKIAISSEAGLARQATHDNLTGLMNRHYLTQYMNEIHKTQSLENHWIAIIDIDDFKNINDQYGHLCGDYVLKTVADAIQKRCADHIVCRWGGEEFMIVGVHEAGTGEHVGDASILLEDILHNIAEEEFVYNDLRLHLTVTIGWARYPTKEDVATSQRLDAWVTLADDRLYKGKQTGKNKIVGPED